MAVRSIVVFGLVRWGYSGGRIVHAEARRRREGAGVLRSAANAALDSTVTFGATKLV